MSIFPPPSATPPNSRGNGSFPSLFSACPAQVCRAIFELRELYEYQLGCANDTINDERVHKTIARATEKSHEAMEDCLREILAMEGWDMATLTLPESLRKKPAKSI